MRPSAAMAKLVVIGVCASQAAAAVIEARAGLKSLFVRQDTACSTTSCSPFQNALDICETTSCLCTRAVAVALNNCVNCYYQQSPTPGMLSTANELIQKYEDTCSAYGDLPHASVTTGPISGSATGPGSVTGTTRSTIPTTELPPITSRSTVTSIAPPTTIAPPPTRTTVQAPPTTTAPGENSGPTGTNGGNGLPSLGDGNGALSNVRDGKWTVVAVAAVALGMLVL